LALVAGSHGTEYTSIIALEKLIAQLNPADISGIVIIVSLINIPDLLERATGAEMNQMVDNLWMQFLRRLDIFRSMGGQILLDLSTPNAPALKLPVITRQLIETGHSLIG
jgi:hypothetical protein